MDAVKQKVFQYAQGKLSPFYSTALENVVHHDYSGNTLPWYDDKPLHPYNHKMTYTEYALSKLPLPIAEASQVYNEAIQSQGASEDTKNAWWKAIEQGLISGTTGVRLFENTKQDGQHYESLPEYFQKGTAEKYDEISNDALSKANKIKDEVKTGKLGVLDFSHKVNSDLNYTKPVRINALVNGVKKLESKLKKITDEKDKEKIQSHVAKVKDAIMRINDAKSVEEVNNITRELSTLFKSFKLLELICISFVIGL